MDKVTMNDFKNNKGFIVVTFLLLALTLWAYMLEPSYTDNTVEQLAFVVFCLLIWPLWAWWFQKAWNVVLTKLVPSVKHISFGVALLLSAVFTILLGV